MQEIAEVTIAGLSLGFLYAIVSLGFVIIYRSSQVINFSHPQFLSLGAFLMYSLSESGIPWGLAFILALIGSGLVAVLVERTVLRPLIGRQTSTMVIVTLFVGLVLHIIITLIWGVETRGLPTPWEPTSTVSILGVNVLFNSLASIIAGMLALISFFLLQRYSIIGIAMRATSLDQEAALALGVPVGRILAITWFIAGSYAAMGGIFLGMFPSAVDLNLGFIAFRAFPAIIVGGIESPIGALLAGLLLGLLEVSTQSYISPLLGNFGHEFHVVFPYIIMLLFMAFRPYGFFGREEVERA